MTIKADFRHLTGTKAGWNEVLDVATSGLKVADLLDHRDVATGYTLTLSTTGGQSISSGAMTDKSWYGFDRDVLNSWWYSSEQLAFVIGGLIVGDTYELEIMSPTNNSNRDTDWTDGQTTGRYLNPGDNVPMENVSPPVVLTGVVDGTGSITVTGTKVGTYLHLSAIILRLGSRAELDIDSVNSGTPMTLGQQAVSIELTTSPDTITGLKVAKIPQTILSQSTVGDARTITFDLEGYFPDGPNLIEVMDGTYHSYYHADISNPYIYSVPDVKAVGSLFEGQTISNGSKFWFEFTGVNADKVSYSGVNSELDGLWGNDVNDWITSDVGFSGDVGVTVHVWNNDDSDVGSYTGTITVTSTGPVITNIDGDNAVYPGQTATINLTEGGDTAINPTLGGSACTLTGSATATTRPVVIPTDLPYGLHQLAVEIPS